MSRAAQPVLLKMPQNLQREIEALGQIIINPDQLGTLIDYGGVDLFFDEANKRICGAMIEMDNAAGAFTLSALVDRLENDEHVQHRGGAGYIASLGDGVIRGETVAYAAKYLKELADKRKLLNLSSQIEERGTDGLTEVEEIIGHVESSCAQIRDGWTNASRGLVHVKTVVRDSFETLDRVWSGEGRSLGVSTGFPSLDENLGGGGCVAGEMTVLAARPSDGKTALASNIAVRMAEQGHGVAFISLETSRQQLLLRLISQLSGIPCSDMASGYLSKSAKKQVLDAMARLVQLPLFIDDRVSRPANAVRATLRQVAKREKIRFAIVDYIQLLTAPGLSRYEVVTNASIQMKAAAKEIGEISGAALLCLAQLNRSSTKDDRLPEVFDLKESGQLEQDADVILLLYKESKDANRSAPHTKTVKVGKCKNGPADVEVGLRYFPAAFRFDELSKGSSSGAPELFDAKARAAGRAE